MVAGGDELAVLAGAVGQVAVAVLAEQGLGENARHRGLARAARSAEEVGVAHALLVDGAHERLDHVVLADDLVERLGTVLVVQGLHASSPTVLANPSSIRHRMRTARTAFSERDVRDSRGTFAIVEAAGGLWGWTFAMVAGLSRQSRLRGVSGVGLSR